MISEFNSSVQQYHGWGLSRNTWLDFDMLKILDIITGRQKRENAAYSAIFHLSQEKKTVRVEIESSSVRFYSKLLLRSGAVVLSYPQEIDQHLREGGWVRILSQDGGGDDLRLQISSLRYSGSGQMSVELGHMTLLCKIPGASFDISKRQSERMQTTRFNNLLLEIPGHPTPFRIVDLSMQGLKIHVSNDVLRKHFHIGDSNERGVIHFGSNFSIIVFNLVTRHHNEDLVGMEMDLEKSESGDKKLQYVLDSLKKKELRPSR